MSFVTSVDQIGQPRILLRMVCLMETTYHAFVAGRGEWLEAGEGDYLPV